MDAQTIDTYDKMAVEYDNETVDFWKRFPRTFLDRFVELSGKRILDVGSGPGRDGFLLKEAGKDVVCIDASSAMVELSKERGLESLCADFTSLPFTDASFDGVWSYTALLHVPKKEIEVPLKEIHRVLRVGGIFALGMIEGDSEEYRESSGVNMPRLFSFYQKAELEDIVTHIGFEPVHFEMFQPGSRNYLNFIFRKT